ncbi:NDP-sugar synthase [Candidatus Bathyarchaeota archaeon]|nr:NDP-sugar synthase [Candidatus Bathyarchaeota archaeon]
MKAVILAGGFGTRLRPLSCTRPKSLFPILNKPLLQWTFEKLAKSGVKYIIMAVSRQTRFQIKSFNVDAGELKIVYSCDPPKKPLGTGGPVKKAEKFIGAEDFLVVNGDIFTSLDYSEIAKFHKEKKAVATIALCRVDDPSRFGVAELTENGRIKKFIEKPPLGKAPTNLINAGVYVLSPEIFRYIPKGRKVSMEREIFTRLAEEGGLYGYVFSGLWTDIGRVEDYLKLNRVLLDSHFFEKKIVGSNENIREPVIIEGRPHIGKFSIIGPHVVLGRNVKIGKHVHVENSVIFPEASIADYASISGVVIGEKAVIGKNVKIEENCVIGDYAVIRDNIFLAKGVSVCPAKEVSENITASRCVM